MIARTAFDGQAASSVRPVVRRLASTRTAFGRELAALLLRGIQRKEEHAGLHADIDSILKEELGDALPSRSSRSLSPAAMSCSA